MRRLVSVEYIGRANTVFPGVCRGFVYAYIHECRVQWSGEYRIYKRISRFCLHCMRRLTGVEYSGRANTVFPGVCRGFASRAGVSDLIDRHHHRCLRRVYCCRRIPARKCGIGSLGFETPEQSENAALGLFSRRNRSKAEK